MAKYQTFSDEKAERPDASASAGDARRLETVEEVSRYLETQGPIVTGPALYRALGYQTSEAFRQARHRGAVKVSLFEIEGRRGVFAYKHQLINYLAGLGGPGAERQQDQPAGGSMD